MLHHSTEYRINGGAWIEITPDEVAGSGKTFTITGLAPGSYNVEMRLTPLVGGGPSVVSNSFTLTVVAGNSVAQIQVVQSESSSGLLTLIATSAQSQNKNAEQASSLLLFIGSIAQVQNIQAESASSSGNVLGSVSESQLVQSESVSGIQTFSGSAIQSQNKQTNTATSAETFAGSVAVSQNKQTSVIVSYETFSGTVAESQQKQAESVTSSQVFLGPFTASVVESQNKQAEAVSANIPVATVEIMTNGSFESDLTGWAKSGPSGPWTWMTVNTNATYVKSGAKSFKVQAWGTTSPNSWNISEPIFLKQTLNTSLDSLADLKLSCVRVGANNGGGEAFGVSFFCFTGSHVAYGSPMTIDILDGSLNDNWTHLTPQAGELVKTTSGIWTNAAINAKAMISRQLTSEGLAWSNVNEITLLLGFQNDASGYGDDGEGNITGSDDVTYYVDSVTTL